MTYLAWLKKHNIEYNMEIESDMFAFSMKDLRCGSLKISLDIHILFMYAMKIQNKKL